MCTGLSRPILCSPVKLALWKSGTDADSGDMSYAGLCIGEDGIRVGKFVAVVIQTHICK